MKLIAKCRGIKAYKSISKESLLSTLSKSESVESETNLDNAKMKKIGKDLNEFRDSMK